MTRRLLGFAVALAALFAAGVLAGGLLDPDAPGGDEPSHEDTGHAAVAHNAGGASHETAAAAPVRGLAAAADGLRLVVADRDLRAGAPEPLRFRVVDADGMAVRDFDIAHTKRMHVIVARRDLTGFQHLHPAMRADGTWSLPLRLGVAGSYRLFADFERDGRPQTLAEDLVVDQAAGSENDRERNPGDVRSTPLPPPAATASDGGYDVRLNAGAARPGAETQLRFTITRRGRPVSVEPYLGAGGHLVALREGDLAFLHVHPMRDVTFAATFPTAGRYRLFLQFQVDGRVQTVAFTHEVRR